MPQSQSDKICTMVAEYFIRILCSSSYRIIRTAIFHLIHIRKVSSEIKTLPNTWIHYPKSTADQCNKKRYLFFIKNFHFVPSLNCRDINASNHNLKDIPTIK